MHGMQPIAAQLTTVEEKLHFLRQSITACTRDCLQPEALAGLAHIVSDLVHSVQEVRRDVDALKSRVESVHAPCPDTAQAPASGAGEEWDEEDAREAPYHGDV